MYRELLNRQPLVLAAGLVLVTLAVYAPVATFGFVNFDDGVYAFGSPLVRAGLQPSAIVRAFTTYEAANYHPLTWLSLMFDRQVFGMNSGAFHAVNAALHVLATLLLFQTLREATGEDRRSAFVAALFAIHPLHVESVAWISERKDMLSGVFWMLTLWCYGRYARSLDGRWYMATLGSFALGLLAKQMLVTLPCVLVLWDIWPLRRWSREVGRDGAGRMFVEKVPFFVLSALFCLLVIQAQHAGNAVQSVSSLSIELRIRNAIVAYVMYLWKTVWPFNLVVFYPYLYNMWGHGGSLVSDPVVGRLAIAAAAVGLALTTLVCLWQSRRRPALLVGWLWYLGTLVPVIGLMQVGGQSMADRYTYIPLIGVFVMLAFGVDWPSHPVWRRRVAILALIVVGLLALRAGDQVSKWRNSRTLFEHAVRCIPSTVAHNNLALILREQGELKEAEKHFREALRYDDNNASAWANLGVLLQQQKKYQAAFDAYQQAMKRRENYEAAIVNLGDWYNVQQRYREAEEVLRKAVRLYPESAGAHSNLGVALHKQAVNATGKDPLPEREAARKRDEAFHEYEESIRLRSDNALGYMNLASLQADLASRRRGTTGFDPSEFDTPIENYEKALKYDPGLIEARVSIALLYSIRRRFDEALAEIDRVPKDSPHYRQAQELRQAIFQARNKVR